MASVINPYLFEKLRQVDPQTDVVSELERAIFSKAATKAGYKGRKAYPSVVYWGECYKLNCPFCGDTKQRLFFCHLAGAHVLIGKTQLQFSVRVCVCQNEHCNSQNRDFRSWLFALELHKGPVIVLDKAYAPKETKAYGHLFAQVEDKLPSPCYPLLSPEVPPHVWNYLRDRKFDPQELQAVWGMGYSPKGATYEKVEKVANLDVDPEYEPKIEKKELYDERIIVPIVQGRRLVGWQGRLPRFKTEKGEIKYMTSDNMSKSQVLFNFDRAVLGSVAVLTEGVFDVMRIGAPAMCLFGKHLSSYQIEALKLGFSQAGGALVMLDPEEYARSERMAAELNEQQIFPRGALAVKLPDARDPADLPPAYQKELIDYHATRLKPLERKVSAKMSADELFAGFTELSEYGEQE